jgi:RNA polymerase sigma-70 factor, ECF subfamily
VSDHDHHTSSPDSWSAFEAEAMPHVDRLFRFAMWMERDRHEAEELVQETLLRALRSFDRFTSGTNCRAWLFTILRNVRSNRRRAGFRRQGREVSDDKLAETVAFIPPVAAHITDEEILSALKGIPDPYQGIVLLADVEELSYREIADVLGIPQGTVMSRLHRGRAHLRKALAATGVAGLCATGS